MGDPVKGTLRRPATRRGEQARATRRRIIDAAAMLFIDNGYPPTTLSQIAEAAGVAVQTVYFHFGNKRTVLKEAVDVAAVGDDEPVPLLDRPWLEQIRAEPDPNRVIALWVQTSRTILDRIAPIMRVVRDAAAGDPDMADQWATNQQQTDTANRLFAQLLADRGALKPDLSVDEATDIVFALLSIELYLLLTGTRGWTPQRWEGWITATLAATLLR
ncbi:MAG TPA: helix-turn-helix domain-containing protein [Aldersonia sp.]